MSGQPQGRNLHDIHKATLFQIRLGFNSVFKLEVEVAMLPPENSHFGQEIVEDF
jgi:hypothetical protein